MKRALKINCLALILLFSLLSSSFLFAGCSNQKENVGSSNQKENEYVGTYQSTFVDSQHVDYKISFTLVINEDKTFVLERYQDDNISSTRSGYYKSYTESDKKQLLCIFDEAGYYWYPYFSACRLDDGTLMITGVVTSSSNTILSALGWGKNMPISLILFNKM